MSDEHGSDKKTKPRTFLSEARQWMAIITETIADAVNSIQQSSMNSKHTSHKVGSVPAIDFSPQNDKYLLRKWWHIVLHDYGQFSCYAIFLLLPADKEALRYLTDFGRELDVISGKNCMVLALNEAQFRRSQIDDDLVSLAPYNRVLGFIEGIWKADIKEHALRGHSLKFAEYFNISFDKFPCLVVFHDIRSPEHIVISLQQMVAEEIAQELRIAFATIQQAALIKSNPLTALDNYRKNDDSAKKRTAVISELRGIAGKTLETVMEAWIKASIK